MIKISYLFLVINIAYKDVDVKRIKPEIFGPNVYRICGIFYTYDTTKKKWIYLLYPYEIENQIRSYWLLRTTRQTLLTANSRIKQVNSILPSIWKWLLFGTNDFETRIIKSSLKECYGDAIAHSNTLMENYYLIFLWWKSKQIFPIFPIIILKNNYFTF